MKDYDVLDAVRQSLDDVHLDRPVETVMAAGRARRRRAVAMRTSMASLALAAVGAGALAWNGIGGPLGDGGGGPGISQGQVLEQTAGFTLMRNADGSITFTFNDVIDPAAATKALNDAGIAGRVVEVGADPTCTVKRRFINPNDVLLTENTDIRALGGDRTSVTLRSSDYPAGGGLLLSFAKLEHPDGYVLMDRFKDAAKIPTCLA